jgi:hypothetical protein
MARRYAKESSIEKSHSCSILNLIFFAQNIAEEMARIYLEENLPDWHFESFMRCTQFMQERIVDIENQKIESYRLTTGIAESENYEATKSLASLDPLSVRSCISSLATRFRQSNCDFSWITSDSFDSFDIDETFGKCHTEQSFAWFCSVMRDRSSVSICDYIMHINVYDGVDSAETGSREERTWPGRGMPEVHHRCVTVK